MPETITCPVCGYDKARRYDYDQGGRGKAQRTGIYMGYCSQCRGLTGSHGSIRVRRDGDTWVAVWAAPANPRHERARTCTWCDAYLDVSNKTGYCKGCWPVCQPRRVAFTRCCYRDCGAWFCYRPGGHGRKFCSRRCSRAQARLPTEVRRPRRSFKRNRRIEIAYQYGYRCASCKKLLNLNAAPGRSNAMEIDHIIELAAGGSDDIANLRPMCTICHRKRRQNDTVQLRIA